MATGLILKLRFHRLSGKNLVLLSQSAQLLQYASLNRWTKGHSFRDYLKSPVNEIFTFRHVTEDTVLKIIDSLEPKSSCGIDSISNKLLKMIKNEILSPFTLIVNQSIKNGIFPDKLKIAKVAPLFKKNEDYLFENYRPISVLPSLSKVLERVIHTQLVDYFTKNNLFYENQYGFRNAHSTELAALELINRVIDNMDKNEVPLAIFLDLSKAFDTIDHKILLHKLNYYGIRETSLKLIESYLSDRKQYVSLDNQNSSFLPVKVGVPQGSILGPLLFIIYINDFHKASSKFHPIVYADDSTLSASLRTFDSADQDRNSVINGELDKVSNWLKLNKLSLNSSKTKALIFHTIQRNVTYPNIVVNSSPVEFVESFNYLGIEIDKHLSWKPHIHKISKKMSKVVGVMSRMKNILPVRVLLTLYNTLFLPYLNYGVLCWKSKLSDLEKLQKKAVRIIINAKYNAHTEPIFKRLKLLKLEHLCSLQELKFCFKLENGILPAYFKNGLFIRNESIHEHFTRAGNDYRIPRMKHEFAKHSIKYVITQAFNECPISLKNKFRTLTLRDFTKEVKIQILEKYSYDCRIRHCPICQ